MLALDMRSWRLVVSVLALSACAHSGQLDEPQGPSAPVEYKPARDPIYGPALVQAKAAYVVERCRTKTLTDGPTDGDPPSAQIVDAGGVEVRQGCGLVANEVYTTAFRARFAHEICGLADDALDEPCEKRFAEMFIARLSERYASADWAAISRRCTAYPFECKTPHAIEAHLLASHNAGISAWYDGAQRYAQARQYAAYQQAMVAQQQLSVQRSAERRQFWVNVGNAVSAMGKAMQSPPTVNCTSNTYGNTTNTSCR
jgi:hypothetical protein